MSDTEPFAPLHAVAGLLSDLPVPWFVCGGWAIDCFLGGMTRDHKDVDIGIPRAKQLAAQVYLQAQGWTLNIAHEGQLTPWTIGEFISLPLHVLWGRNEMYKPDFVELLLNEIAGEIFASRRDTTITLPMARAVLRTPDGLRYLAPEVALLYKSGGPTLEENARDFATALPALDGEQREWLRAALAKTRPDHPWLAAFG